MPATQTAVHRGHREADEGAWDPRACPSLVCSPVKPPINKGLCWAVKTPGCSDSPCPCWELVSAPLCGHDLRAATQDGPRLPLPLSRAGGRVSRGQLRLPGRTRGCGKDTDPTDVPGGTRMSSVDLGGLFQDSAGGGQGPDRHSQVTCMEHGPLSVPRTLSWPPVRGSPPVTSSWGILLTPSPAPLQPGYAPVPPRIQVAIADHT